MNGKEKSAVKTSNALIAVHTLLKPYKYFHNPGMDKEAAPPELEAIVKALLEPLLGMLSILAQGTLTAAAAERGDPAAIAALAAKPSPDQAGNDALLHTLLKCFHHTVAAYMPTSLLPSLPRWLEVLVKILEQAPSFSLSNADDAGAHCAPRARAVKRVIQALMSLVTRHRRHVDKALPAVCSHASALAGALANARLSSDAAAHGGSSDVMIAAGDRQCALCFDLLARISETAPGFKLLAPNFGRLLEQAIFPALCMAPADEEDWRDDEEEYLRKNLPAESDDATGFNEELYAPRQSAANVLGLLAERGSAGGAHPGGKDDRGKRKKGGGSNRGGAKRAPTTPGDVALRFLERFRLPGPDDAGAITSPDARAALSSYYGVLVAYGAMSRWLGAHAPKGVVSTLARQRVLPALATAGGPGPGADGASPAATMVRANACWALGELSATEALPEGPTHEALLRTLTDPAAAEDPVLRSAAASAIASALHASCWPKDWAPLLTAAAAAADVGAGADADDADPARLRALRLVAVAAEVAPEHCGATELANPLAAALARSAAAFTPAPPRTLPTIVETALESLVAVVDAAQEVVDDAAVDDEGEDDDASLGRKPPHASLVALVPHVCDALRRAWLPEAWGLAAWPTSSADVHGGVGADHDGMMGADDDGDAGAEGSPIPCCMGDMSRLLSRAIRWCPDANASANVSLESLVAAHAKLLPDWDAWEEEEEEAACDVIADVAAAHARGRLRFSASGGGVDDVLSSYATFLSGAIDGARALGVARACRASHAVASLAARVAGAGPGRGPARETDVARSVASAVVGAASARLESLASPDMPVARPLVLAVGGVLARSASDGAAAMGANAAQDWARAAALTLVTHGAEMSASELHVLASAALRALGGGGSDGLGLNGGVVRDPAARAAAAEAALRAVLALRDLRASGGGLGHGSRKAEEEDTDDDDDDDDDEDDDDDDDSDDDDDDSDADDSDSDDDGGRGRGGADDEETEHAFLARYAAEARKLAGAGPEDPDAGDVDDADDGSELELDGIVLGPPGAEATALLRWLQSSATAADLGALAATLAAHPVAGLEAVGDLQSVLSSMGCAPGSAHGGGGGGGGGWIGNAGSASPGGSQGSAGNIDFGGLRL